MKEKNKLKIYLVIKLFILNVIIILFGIGTFFLIQEAIEVEHSPGMLGALTPLSMALIGLISLEIKLIFNHIDKTRRINEKN